MKSSILFILVAIGLGISGFGLLANEVGLNLQEFGAIPTISEFNSFNCECENVNFEQANFDPNDPDTFPFGMQFCDLDKFLDPPTNLVPNPGYIGDVAAMTCSWETHQSQYGTALYDNYWIGEACDAEFWESNMYSLDDYAWPDEYAPAKFYNDVFLTDLSLFRVLVSDEEDITAEPIAPTRGRVSSDGITVGTATFAREPTTEDSGTTEDGSSRSTTDSDEYVEKVVQNAVSPSNESPALATLMQLPDIEGDYNNSLNDLTRESIAALLNAAHPKIDYPYDESEVISMTKDAVETGIYQNALLNFKFYNNQLNENSLCP